MTGTKNHQVNVIVRLDDWDLHALTEHAPRFGISTKRADSGVIAQEVIHYVACTWIEILRTSLLDTRFVTVGMPHWYKGDVQELRAECVAQWWADQSPGIRAEFLQRIGAQLSYTDGAYFVDPLKKS